MESSRLTRTTLAATGHRPPPRVSRHAIERYQLRVEPSSTFLTAKLRMEQFAALGRARSTPRHWLRGRVAATPGLRFLFWSQRPDICGLVIDDVIVTVLPRWMFSGTPARASKPTGRPPIVEVARWRWDGQIIEEAEAA